MFERYTKLYKNNSKVVIASFLIALTTVIIGTGFYIYFDLISTGQQYNLRCEPLSSRPNHIQEEYEEGNITSYKLTNIDSPHKKKIFSAINDSQPIIDNKFRAKFGNIFIINTSYGKEYCNTLLPGA